MHGPVLAPDLGRLYASATGRNEVDVVDTSTLKVGPAVAAGNYPDGLAYVPGAGKVYVSNEQDSAETVIDARAARRLGSIQIGGDIGNSQYDSGTGRVYVASGTGNQLVVVDPSRDAVLERDPLAGCEGAHGVQVDVPERARVFVACEGNAKVVVLDLTSRKVTGTLDVGDGRTCWRSTHSPPAVRRRGERDSDGHRRRVACRQAEHGGTPDRTPTASPWTPPRTWSTCP